MAVTAIYGLHLNGNRKANEMREQNLRRPEDIIGEKIKIDDFFDIPCGTNQRDNNRRIT